MGLISDIYHRADKGDASNVVLNDETIHEMQGQDKRKRISGYSNGNVFKYGKLRKVDNFLKECLKGKSGSVVVYELHSDGGIGRDKFIFDGENMYLMGASATWNMKDALDCPIFPIPE